MDKYRDILNVSLPMVSGAGIMAALIICLHIPPYPVVLISMPVSAVMAVIAYIGQRPETEWGFSKGSLFWAVTFFMTGILSFGLFHIIPHSIFSFAIFSKTADAITKTIESIPFQDKENNALLTALITGDRSHLSESTVVSFRNAGAAHMLALSGMHLGIIYLAVNRILAIAGNSPHVRKMRCAATIAVTGLYTCICGAGPSLLRAWLFILLNESAKILERPQPPQQIFCAALTLHIIMNPASITGIGFQLSYLAMVGIVFVWPGIRGWMDSKIWQAVSLSISCQLFTAPLTLIKFGTFPKFFMITNLIAAPLLPVAMCMGIIAAGLQACGIGCVWAYRVCEMPASALRCLLEIIAGM